MISLDLESQNVLLLLPPAACEFGSANELVIDVILERESWEKPKAEDMMPSTMVAAPPKAGPPPPPFTGDPPSDVVVLPLCCCSGYTGIGSSNSDLIAAVAGLWQAFGEMLQEELRGPRQSVSRPNVLSRSM